MHLINDSKYDALSRDKFESGSTEQARSENRTRLWDVYPGIGASAGARFGCLEAAWSCQSM